eukprot:gene23529-9053_t
MTGPGGSEEVGVFANGMLAANSEAANAKSTNAVSQSCLAEKQADETPAPAQPEKASPPTGLSPPNELILPSKVKISRGEQKPQTAQPIPFPTGQAQQSVMNGDVSMNSTVSSTATSSTTATASNSNQGGEDAKPRVEVRPLLQVPSTNLYQEPRGGESISTHHHHHSSSSNSAAPRAPQSPLGSPVSTPTAMLFPQTPFASLGPYYANLAGGHNPFAPDANNQLARSPTHSFNPSHSPHGPHGNYFHPMFNNFPPFVQMSLQPPPPPPSPQTRSAANSFSTSTAGGGGPSPHGGPGPGPLPSMPSLPRLPSSLSTVPSFIDRSPQHSFANDHAQGGKGRVVYGGAYPAGVPPGGSKQEGTPPHGGGYDTGSALSPPPQGGGGRVGVHDFYSQAWGPGIMNAYPPMAGVPTGYSHDYTSDFGAAGLIPYNMLAAMAGVPIPMQPYDHLTGAEFMFAPPMPPPPPTKGGGSQQPTGGVASSAGPASSTGGTPGGKFSTPPAISTGTPKQQRNLLEAKVGPDGLPRLNSRQRRTLRRAKERAIKGLMEAGHMQLQKHANMLAGFPAGEGGEGAEGGPGRAPPRRAGSDAGEENLDGEGTRMGSSPEYCAEMAGMYLEAAFSVASGCVGPSAAAAASQMAGMYLEAALSVASGCVGPLAAAAATKALSKVAAELHSSVISDLIASSLST